MDRRRSSILVPDIYEATINPSHWEYVMELMAQLTKSKAACLYYLDKDMGIANTVAQFGCTVDMFPDFKRQFAKLDTLFDKTASTDIKEESLCQIFSLKSESFKDTERDFYEDYLKPYGIYHLGRIQFLDSNQHKAAIAILRDEAAGPWDKGDIRVIQEIIPHFKRALDIHAEFTRLRVQQDTLVKGLDRLVIGLILYDKDAHAVYINPTARAIIKSHPALQLHDDGLALHGANDDMNLRQTILDTAKIEPEDSWKQSVAIGITHPKAYAPLPILVTPMHAHLLTSDLNYEGARVAVFLSDPNQQQPISVDNLVSVYHLTPSEAQVAIGIANGHSIDDIARTSNHSTHTIRSQLKSTFRKTGVCRQSALIKLLLTGPFAHRRRSGVH